MRGRHVVKNERKALCSGLEEGMVSRMRGRHGVKDERKAWCEG